MALRAGAEVHREEARPVAVPYVHKFAHNLEKVAKFHAQAVPIQPTFRFASQAGPHGRYQDAAVWRTDQLQAGCGKEALPPRRVSEDGTSALSPPPRPWPSWPKWTVDLRMRGGESATSFGPIAALSSHSC
ncbi:uncharacterized protein [Dermacentor albipictus]|uniref:uncharacterized protein n=1 Tax=Dermacentor albipictus TaxID=60249 RepID=UPI0038FCB37E